MSLNERLISVGAAACTTDSADVFGDGSGVALYTLDYDGSEASGLYDGTPDSAVQFGVAGVTNYAARFSSNTTGIVNTSLKLNSTAHSISLWVKPAEVVSGRWNTIFMSAFLGYPYGFLGKRPDQSTSFHYRTESGNELYFTLSSADTWYHIVITRDSGGVDIYVDGSFVTSNSDSMGTYSSSSYEKTAIGSNPLYPAEYFKGDVDQVRIFNKVLSTDEIATLYNSGAGETACVYTCTTDTVDYPTTNVAYYKLDNSAEDETGIYDGTPTNINYTFGRFGQAAVFNGSSSEIDLPVGLGASGNRARSLWINVSAFPASGGDVIYYIGQQGVNDDYEYLSVRSDGTIRYQERHDSGGAGDLTIDSQTTISLNQWYNITIVFDGLNRSMYINSSTALGNTGTKSTQTVDNSAYAGNLGSFRGLAGTATYDGKIDQVRIFSSALTSTQVTELYEEYECEDTSTFKPVLYTGNGSTQYVSNVGFEPDLVWIKDRDSAYSHILTDSVRGAGTTSNSKILNTNNSNEEGWSSHIYGYLSSFDSNGFTVTTGSTGAQHTNLNGDDYVAWVWKAGDDAISNTDGSITSQVSANTDAGFSIVKYTGNATAGATIGHGLSSAPELIIGKRLVNAGGNWTVYAEPVGATAALQLNTDIGAATATAYFNDTAPTNSVFTLGSNGNLNNTEKTIAYCFHSVAGYSKIGSYEGNGTTATTTITTGFKPSWVMIKRTDSANDWVIYDDKRDTTSPLSERLFANTDGTESDGGTTSSITISPTGFSMTTSQFGGSINTDGGQYLYMAFK